MASIGKALSFLTIIALSLINSYSSVVTTSASLRLDIWLGIKSAKKSNQNEEISLRIFPFSGIGVGIITSKADILSLVIINKCLSSTA